MRSIDVLPDPDVVGTTAYYTVYKIVDEVLDESTHTGEDPEELVKYAFVQVEREIQRVRSLLFDDVTQESDPWDLTRQRADDYADWQALVANGDSLRGFIEHVRDVDEQEDE